MTAQTVRGAKRALTDAKRNRDWAASADVPIWPRAACEARVTAAQKRLRELEQSHAS